MRWEHTRLRFGPYCIGGYEKYRNMYLLYSRLPGLNFIGVGYCTKRKARRELEKHVRDWLKQALLEEKSCHKSR